MADESYASQQRVCRTMKKQRSELKCDVRDLLDRTLIAESSVTIWAQFERALKELDRTSLMVLRRYFDGSSYQEIAKRLQISETQSKDLVTQGKRQLVETMRRHCKVRQ